MSLFLRSPRTSQPQSSADIDWSSPLVGGAKLLISGSEQRNLVTGKRPDVQVGVRQLYAGREGIFDSAYSGASTGLSDDQYSIPSTTDFALLARVDHSGSSGNLAAILGGDGTGNRQFQLRFTVSNTVEFIRFNTAVGNVSCSVPAASRRGTVLAVSIGNSIYLYFGGASASATITGTPQPLTKISIGGGFGFDAFTYSTDSLYMAAVLQGSSVKSASSSLIGNPWQLFKSVSRSLWIPGTVSSGGTTNATVTQSDSADTTSLNATVTTGATVAFSDGVDTQAVAAANWMTAQLASSDGADTQAIAATAGGITLAGITQTDGWDATAITMANWTAALIAHGDAPDTTAVTGNIVGVTSASVAAFDAADAQAIATLVTTGAVILGTDGADTALASAACWTMAIMAAVNGADTTNIVGTAPGTAVYPLESQVQAGVQYGPTGADYTGTLTGGSGPSAADIAAAVRANLSAELTRLMVLPDVQQIMHYTE